MMDYRKYIVAAIVALSGIGNCMAQSDGFSLGALDVVCGRSAAAQPESVGSSGALEGLVGSVRSSGDDIFPAGALEAVLTAGKVESDPSGALALVASAGKAEMRPGVLSFIKNAASQSNYYAAGVWESFGSTKGGGGAMWSGEMLPVPAWGKITSKFGFRPRFGRMHKGIDIAMTVGDTVCVPLAGVVDRINYEAGGYGHYIVVKHDNGLETRYAHLSATLVRPGETVQAFQPIALSGNTGNSTGPHLHFETRVLGSAIDPMTVFDFAGGMMTLKNRKYMPAPDYRKIASGALAGVAAKGIPGRSLDDKRTYVVRAGDTLQRIAARAGVSVADLCRLNCISEHDPLNPGVMLRIRK